MDNLEYLLILVAFIYFLAISRQRKFFLRLVKVYSNDALLFSKFKRGNTIFLMMIHVKDGPSLQPLMKTTLKVLNVIGRSAIKVVRDGWTT